MITNKYKTSMCKHFEQHGKCYMAEKCHFAHGFDELRNINDPVPTGIPQQGGIRKPPMQGMQGGQHSNPSETNNFKTAKCKYFDQGGCKFGDKCNFAHGDEELRSPSHSNSQPSPQRTQASGVTNQMASLYATIQSQIAQQQIQDLCNNMQNYHADDPELLGQIQQANEFNQKGDSNNSSSILYAIMNRPDKTQEDAQNYSGFTFNMQNLGNQLFQQFQMQQNYAQTNTMQMGGVSPSQNQAGGGYKTYNNYNKSQGGYQKQYQQGGNKNYGNGGARSNGYPGGGQRRYNNGPGNGGHSGYNDEQYGNHNDESNQ
jgi:hypothetical protein